MSAQETTLHVHDCSTPFTALRPWEPKRLLSASVVVQSPSSWLGLWQFGCCQCPQTSAQLLTNRDHLSGLSPLSCCRLPIIPQACHCHFATSNIATLDEISHYYVASVALPCTLVIAPLEEISHNSLLPTLNTLMNSLVAPLDNKTLPPTIARGRLGPTSLVGPPHGEC